MVLLYVHLSNALSLKLVQREGGDSTSIIPIVKVKSFEIVDVHDQLVEK